MRIMTDPLSQMDQILTLMEIVPMGTEMIPQSTLPLVHDQFLITKTKCIILMLRTFPLRKAILSISKKMLSTSTLNLQKTYGEVTK